MEMYVKIDENLVIAEWFFPTHYATINDTDLKYKFNTSGKEHIPLDIPEE